MHFRIILPLHWGEGTRAFAIAGGLLLEYGRSLTPWHLWPAHCAGEQAPVARAGLKGKVQVCVAGSLGLVVLGTVNARRDMVRALINLCYRSHALRMAEEKDMRNLDS